MKRKKDETRVQLSKCVGKICAYLAVGNTEQAKVWANTLVNCLKKLDLLG